MPRLALLLSLVFLTLCGAAGKATTQADQTIVMQGVVAALGTYSYFPFQVPAGVNRVAVKITKDSDQTKIGAGLFDWRGAGFQSPGFRGIYGEEINEFYVASDSASRAFVAGPILPGTWTVMVPVFRAATPTNITVTVTLSFGEQLPTPPLQPPPAFVRAGAGWYAGDLHDYTTFSSDAFSSRSALDPAAFAQRAKETGLDWVALTDHNVTAQNDRLTDAAPAGFLLIAGEETTNWFHGHSVSIGMAPGDYFDWRWRPLGTPIDPTHEGRVIDYLKLARARGIYTAAAHPFGAYLAWECFADSENDASALPDGFEVWNGPFQPDDQATLNKWDQELSRGRRVWANGGSDVHGLADPTTDIGFPTTVVYADALSRDAVVTALKAGRSYITKGPSGPGLFLNATGPQNQQQMVGGTIYGASTDVVSVSVLVRGGNGLRLLLYRNGAQTVETPITADPQTVTSDQAIGTGGYVRAELRDTPAPEGDMRALTNPIFLVQGAAPSVVSRKTHGSAGTFEIELPLTGPRGIECRSGGPNSNHTLVFTFANTLLSVGGANLTSGCGQVQDSAIGSDPHQYMVNLTGVCDAQTIAVTLSSVADSAGNLGAISASMGVLAGDTNADGTVNSGDAIGTRNRSGQATALTNFRFDLNADGTINSGDAVIVRAKSGGAISP